MKTTRNECAITTRGLKKAYGTVEALRGVELEVERGEIFGFLGPNGAGKTTTIRCLLDLIRPDEGSIRILGLDPQADPVSVRARTGYLPGELHLYGNLTARRQLAYFSALRGQAVEWHYVQQLAEQLNLDLSRQIKNLSKGNKQKVGLVQALMHKPDVLLLDEPTSGLDPLIQHEVEALLHGAAASGTTVFFSSHVLSEVESIAGRVGIIRQGEIVEVAQPEALTSRALRQVTVRFHQPVDTGILEKLSNVRMLPGPDKATATMKVQGDMDELIKALGAFPVAELETNRPSLEEAFLEYYQAQPKKELV